MPLQSLLFSRDPEIIKLTDEVLKTLDIEVSQCGEASEAVSRLAATRFNAIIVDNADVVGAIAVLSAAKSLPSCEESLGIVLAVSITSLGLAAGAQSHMVLYRPLSAERLRTGIKSLLGLRGDGEDARESQRASINIPATLRGAGLDDMLVFITSLSAGGAALQVGESVSSSSIHSIEFSLPGNDDNLSASLELVWRDVEGRVGVRFKSTSATFGESVEKWVKDQAPSQRSSKASA